MSICIPPLHYTYVIMVFVARCVTRSGILLMLVGQNAVFALTDNDNA